MSRVFEELNPLLKDIRIRLHDLNLHKASPKARKPSSKKKSQSQAASIAMPTEDYVGGKAGKIAYPVMVGEVMNLYKTFKYSNKNPITIDLHGFTKDEALKKLDESLSGWVDTAMGGEYPWVIPVDVICGGGGQILSEAVKDWIRSNRQVANRPKRASR